MSAPALAVVNKRARPHVRKIGAGHPRFVRGFYETGKGYLRISSGPDRGKFVHKKVMEVMLAETDTSTLAALGIAACAPAKIPERFHVEHLDHRRKHNCPENLILLEAAIHNHISFCSTRSDDELPDWVDEASVLESEVAVLEVCE